MFLALAACVPAPGQGLAQHEAAADPVSSGLITIEQTAGRVEVYVGEPFEVVVRLAVEREALDQRLLQLFQTRLDVPVQIDVPWLGGNERLLVTGPAIGGPGQEPGASLVLGAEIASARRAGERSAEGRRFAVFEIARTLVPLVPGALELAAPSASFAHSKGNREGLTGIAIPIERRDATVWGEALARAVLELPDAGRPVDFSGAVGRFAIQAQVDRREVELGASVTVVLTVERLDSDVGFLVPLAERVPGFRILGALEKDAIGREVLVYDLAPIDARVDAVPAIEFSYFDPTPPGGYQRIASEPIAIRVRGPAALPAALPAERAGDGAPAREDAARTWPWIAGAGLAGLAALALWRFRRLRRRPPG